jgi:hypothetical protein
VGGETHNITQAGVACSYSISPAGNTIASPGGSDSFNVTAPAGCAWTPAESDSWITLTSGAGSGDGTVSYTIAENTGAESRSGTITLQDQTYGITQLGVSCSYSISPDNNSFSTAGGSDTFSVTAPSGCGWAAVESDSWITLTSGAGSGDGSVSFDVAVNSSASTRSGSITVQDKSYSISQEGVSCSYSISAGGNTFGSEGGSNSFGVTAPDGCNWTPVESSAWIKLSSGAGTGDGTVVYNVTENTSTSSRSGTITVEDQVYSITESGISCKINTVSESSEVTDKNHEACEVLIAGPDYTIEDGASVFLSSGREILFGPGFNVEPGASINADVCGQSLCKTSPSPMPEGCHSCVIDICEIDPACCDTAFDQACLDKVATVCNLACK